MSSTAYCAGWGRVWQSGQTPENSRVKPVIWNSEFRPSSMPEMSGLDLARAAKNRGIPIVFSTGHQLPKESMQLALGCINKPYTERTLKLALDAVDKRLGGKKPKPPKGLELFVPEEG